VEVDSVPMPASTNGEQLERADLIVAMLAELDERGIAALTEGLRALPGSRRIVVILRDGAAIPPRNSPPTAETESHLTMIPWPALGLDMSGQPIPSISAGYQSIFAASLKLEAQACCVIVSKLENETPQRVSQFVQPLLEADFDLVAPYYARHRLEGLLNSAIVSPLCRSLYGRRIQNPMGPDLAISQRLFQKVLSADSNVPVNRRIPPLASLTPLAACSNLRVCQVHLGARSYPPADWTNVSSVLVEVLGPIFLEMEKNAVCWQRVRESVAVPLFGDPFGSPTEAGPVDVERLVNSFQLGVRDLQEIWSLVLPPASLFELRKLARLTPEQFAMPDELWVRVVYDFALAHRLRVVNHDHLVRSMAPLYLGWVASHARAIATAEAESVEDRFERLAIAYQTNKPYLVSRWRWPDRFNP
jgi:glucosylglycerate synthase